MASKGPKIKELARELGTTSRRLIERCRAEGIHAQNSASRLDRASAERLRAWYAARPAPDASATAHEDPTS